MLLRNQRIKETLILFDKNCRNFFKFDLRKLRNHVLMEGAQISSPNYLKPHIFKFLMKQLVQKEGVLQSQRNICIFQPAHSQLPLFMRVIEECFHEQQG